MEALGTKPAKPKVVVIDCSPESQHLYSRILKHYDVKSFDSAESFLPLLSILNPDIVVVDINLPSSSGYEICRYLREYKHLEKYLGIVLVAETLDPYVVNKGLAVGADDFVRKSEALIELQARVRSVMRLKRMTDELTKSRIEAVLSFVKVAESNDADTGGHIERMGHYSALLYDKCGFDKAACENMRLAAMLHDIGKVCTPDKVLKKPGSFTDEEWEVMKLHASKGYEISAAAESPLLKLGATIARTHHEKWDGTGYPQGLKGEDIPIEARIVALADVFDALLSKRCYKEKWPLDKVLDTIRNGREKHFDPFLVDLFFNYLDDFLQIREQVEGKQALKGSSAA
ncbi:MAG: HD domain-containing protein [Oligoflexales bacterium]|nr:HD domain-containing protein [Oligoflexales bacterium]